MPVYDFGSGRTDPTSFPTAQLAEAAKAAVLEVGADLVHYPGDMGHEGLRRLMAQRESKREGVQVSPEHIALMNGSMQAVTLVAEALMEKPGDLIITEELTYSGTIGAYQGLGAKLVGVPLDQEGMRIDALETVLADLAAKGTMPRFIYTLTTYQNPTGAVMSKARRQQLIEVARRYQLPVVEDNCYADVHFEGAVEPALYALDPDPNHIYLCSLSKILGPGIRLGYILARPPMLNRILNRRYDGGNSVLAAAAVAALFKDNLWAHIEHCNTILKEKRDALFAAFDTHLGDLCTWSKPVGGMFVWLQLPAGLSGKAIAEQARARGFLCAAGAGFHIHRQDIPYLRLAFGFASLEAIADGIPLLAECLRNALAEKDPATQLAGAAG